MNNDAEQQWEDVDEKVILVQILMELQQIRVALQRPEDEPDQRWSCRHCTWEGTNREEHLGTHGATKGMIDEVFELA